jgi:biopolymer transport protein ExbD
MKRRFKLAGQFKLQLTSLMDMFTIILVFLLVSMSSEDADFVRDESVNLPLSKAGGRFEPAVNVVVSNQYVKVQENVVARLADGEVTDEQVKAGRLEAVVRAVRRAREQREGQQQEAESEGGDEEIILIQADRSLPYRTVYLVMRSCSIAGFNRYRITIQKE